MINPGPPGTCGGVITVELCRALQKYYNVEHLFVEEKSLCEQSDWGGEPAVPVPFTIKPLRHWQVHWKMGRYDLYHYMSERNLPLARRGRTPAAFTCHGLAPLKARDVYTENTKRRFGHKLRHVHLVDMVIANSKNTAADLAQILAIPASKIEVVYFGINHGLFKPRPAREARERLGIPPEALVILNVGSERKNKNIERLLSVFKALAGEFDNLQLVRVGDKDRFFTKMLSHLGLAGRVLRPGRVVNPSLYYNAADVYLCMDLHASFGMPNLEAMASGCPVVSSNVEAIPEIVGDACRFADPRNVEETAGALREVLNSGSLREELRDRGLKRAAQFTWEKCAGQTADVYSKILKKA